MSLAENPRRLAFIAESTVLCPPLPPTFTKQFTTTPLGYVLNSYSPAKDAEGTTLPDSTSDNGPFCESLLQGAVYNTTIASPEDYKKAYEEISQRQPTDIIVFCSDLRRTGGMNSAQTGIGLLNPESNIRVFPFDTGSIYAGPVLIPEADEMAKTGLSAQEIVERLEELKRHLHLIFTTTSLKYLEKGAAKRGMTVAALGLMAMNTIKVTPVLKYEEGNIHMISKLRTPNEQKAPEKLNQEMANTIGAQPVKRAAVFYSHPPEPASNLATLLKEKGITPEKPPVFPLSKTVTTYLGPNSWGVIFIEK